MDRKRSGIIGTVALGFIALPVEGVGGGLFYGGGITQLVAQLAVAGTAIAYSAVMTTIIALAIHKTMGFRVSQEQEVVGVDLSLHAETAYEFGVGGHGGADRAVGWWSAQDRASCRFGP